MDKSIYIKRNLEHTLLQYLKYFPVIGITGPRQSGKSTMLLNSLGNKYKYISFDDYKNVNLFSEDPERFVKMNNGKVIFDEVQKVPEIFNYIKVIVDKDRLNYGNFILTGSNQFSIMKNISESLAGRIGLLSLLPFDFNEIPDHLKNTSIYNGGYPELVIRDYKFSNQWYSSYIQTYLERDLKLIINIGDIRDFNQLIKYLAINTSQILDISKISRELGISVNTVKRWISVLEASYIIFLLPPYYMNKGKQIVKRPKIYFYDTGLVSYLTGIESEKDFENGVMTGSLFENYIISEVIKKEIHKKSDANFYFYKTNHGIEIDLIIDRKKTQNYIEIKSSYSFKTSFLKSILSLKEKNQMGILVYRGDDIPYAQDIKVLNYQNFLK